MSEFASTATPVRFVSLLHEANACADSYRLSEARAAFSAAIKLDPGCLARIEFGCFLARIDAHAEALEQFSIVLDVARKNGDDRLRAAAYNNLAAIHRKIGQFDVAARLQQQSLAAEFSSQKVRNLDAMMACDFANLANDAIQAGDLDLAERLLLRSLAWEVEQGSQAGEADDLASLGIVAGLQGNAVRGKTLLCLAYRLHCRLADERGAGCDLLNLAELYRRSGQWSSATRCLKRAFDRFKSAHASILAAKAGSLLREAIRVEEVAKSDPLRN